MRISVKKIISNISRMSKFSFFILSSAVITLTLFQCSDNSDRNEGNPPGIESNDDGSADNDDPSDDSQPEMKEWTLLFYIGGDDSDLEDNAIDDFNNFEQGYNSDNYNVAIQLDRRPGGDISNGDWDTCRRYLLTRDTIEDNIIRSELIEDLGEVNMGDPQTLTDFITWGMENNSLKAKRYGLLIWGSAAPMGILTDNTDTDSINTMSGELTLALEQALVLTERRIDLLTLWGCNYGTLEHDFVIKEYADVTLRSQLATWNAEGAGINILAWLNQNTTAGAKEFADAWLDAYTDYAITQVRCTGWSALDLGPGYLSFHLALDNFARELIKAGGIGQGDINTAITNTVYTYDFVMDINHFAKNISENISLPAALRDAAQSLIDTYGDPETPDSRPLINFRFSDGSRPTNEIWPAGDTAELRGSMIYQEPYATYGNGSDYLPFVTNNTWRYFIEGETALPVSPLVTYESNTLGDTILADGLSHSFNITLRNSGGLAAENVTIIISSYDPDVNFVQNTSTVPDISSEGNAATDSELTVILSQSTPAKRRIWFTISINANGGGYNNETSFCFNIDDN